MRDTFFIETLHPPLQRGFPVHAQARTDDAARAAALTGHGPIKECQICARAAFRIRVKQVVGAHVVLIDGALDQAHAESLCVKTMILPYRCRDRCEVMNASEFHDPPVLLDAQQIASHAIGAPYYSESVSR